MKWQKFQSCQMFTCLIRAAEKIPASGLAQLRSLQMFQMGLGFTNKSFKQLSVKGGSVRFAMDGSWLDVRLCIYFGALTGRKPWISGLLV